MNIEPNAAQPVPAPDAVLPVEQRELDKLPAVWQPEALMLLRQLRKLTGQHMGVPLDANGNDPERAIKNMRRTVDGLAAMAPKERKSFLKKLAKPRPKLHKYR